MVHIDPAHEADIEAIKQVVSVVEHSQQNELPDESSACSGTISGQPAVVDEPGEGSPLYVMVKEDGKWLLVACRNTAVVDA
jgi:hypothetical protein